MDKPKLTENVKAEAAALGFQLTGVAPAVSPDGYGGFQKWLAAGYAGQMHYLTERAQAYADPNSVLEGVRSICMLGMSYQTCVERFAPTEIFTGKVARYAWGTLDYHDLIHQRLKKLISQVKQWSPEAKVRGIVDTAPLLEREFAQLAGLGWIGKNTLLINKNQQGGSWFFLAALLTDLELEYDAPHQTDHCGTCTACLTACPTDAFVEPYVLDATKCISYLTIELRGPVPQALRSGMEDWVFGCDICQDVCPWNRKTIVSEETSLEPQKEMNPLELLELFELDDETFRRRFRKTPLWRSKRRGLVRNAAIVLGNYFASNQQRVTSPVLRPLQAALTDSEPLIRGAVVWALGQLNTQESHAILRKHQEIETDQEVQQELSLVFQSKQS